MKILQIIIIGVLYFLITPPAFAVEPPCEKVDKRPECVFGTISPPPELQKFIGTDSTGAAGISKFLSNLITLIYSLAAVVLIFMLLWGAWDWLTSEGEKEKLESAKKKIVNAIVGIMLFAVAFAVIQVLGTFTGFTFFVGQK